MLKLYLKKLLTIVFYLILFFTICVIGYNVLFTISNFFKSKFVMYIFVIGIPAFIIFEIVYHYRCNNLANKRSYISNNKDKKMNLKNEFSYILNFPDFQAEILSFVTIIVGFFIFIAIQIVKSTDAPWYAQLFAGLITGVLMFGIGLAICFVLDFLFWILIHIKWRKNNIHN